MPPLPKKQTKTQPLEPAESLEDADKENHEDDEEFVMLIRPDGTPTYFLATPFDDLSTHVTHVIRGREWMRMQRRYEYCAKALLLSGAVPPAKLPSTYYLPLVVSDGRKISKRSFDKFWTLQQLEVNPDLFLLQ